MRFGKRIRLGSHVQLNISKSGLGMAAGAISAVSGESQAPTNVPGTGIRYSRRLGGTPTASNEAPALTKASGPRHRDIAIPAPPTPGTAAPADEKAFYTAVQNSATGKQEAALRHLLDAAGKDPGAGILAAMLLAEDSSRVDMAIACLEAVVASDAEFPTPLMQRYIGSATMTIEITDEVQVTVPIDGLGAVLLLAELYQQRDRFQEAIGVLEELDELIDNSILTLSLCDLYAAVGIWDGIISCAEKVTITDDITLETALLRGRAFQEKGLHEAAISAFTEALKKKKDRDPDLLHEALYWRAISYEAAGKKSQANKEFQKIYAAAPNFRDVGTRIGA